MRTDEKRMEEIMRICIVDRLKEIGGAVRNDTTWVLHTRVNLEPMIYNVHCILYTCNDFVPVAFDMCESVKNKIAYVSNIAMKGTTLKLQHLRM